VRRGLGRGVCARQRLDERRQNLGADVGHRDPVHPGAACVRDMEAAHGA
jgi:hypothetical protein